MQTQTDSVSALNDILRGEISAVETYRQALEKIVDPTAREQLEDVERKHEKHVALLRARISALGGKPAESSGAWGAFARLLEGGAKVFGVKPAIAVLEEGEDQGLRTYRKHLGEVDPESRRLIEQELLPEQEQTHAVLSSLKRTIH
jgi:rubrerythrin